MKKLTKIPHPEFEQHEEAGTLGDSEQMTETDLATVDRQLKLFGLELVVFDNGAAVNWFVAKPTP